jgi:putative two-component system response regulator
MLGSALIPASLNVLGFHAKNGADSLAGVLPQDATVLLLDNVVVNRKLLRGMLKNYPYRILEASCASQAFHLLETHKVDLIVLDLVLPDIGGTEFCVRLRANPNTQLIPTLILTSVQGVENEVAGLSSGADEFLLKPLNPVIVRARVQAMLRQKALIDNLDMAENILFALAEAVEQRDQGTGDHCRRLAATSRLLGESINLSERELLALHRGAYLHDIGKICVADAILFKPGPLTNEEWAVMRQHPEKGESICKPMRCLASALPIIRNHHERWDGSGYPDGLKGEEIPLLARILQLADIYDALVSPRCYKAGMSSEQAVQMIREEARRGWRDPDLVEHFCAVIHGVSTESTVGQPPPIRHSLENMARQLAV